jgi:hypothetical protein
MGSRHEHALRQVRELLTPFGLAPLGPPLFHHVRDPLPARRRHLAAARLWRSSRWTARPSTGRLSGASEVRESSTNQRDLRLECRNPGSRSHASQDQQFIPGSSGHTIPPSSVRNRHSLSQHHFREALPAEFGRTFRLRLLARPDSCVSETKTTSHMELVRYVTHNSRTFGQSVWCPSPVSNTDCHDPSTVGQTSRVASGLDQVPDQKGLSTSPQIPNKRSK